ncbi:arylsulfatase [Rubinisphaera brasiliensis]|uniref:Sulfatase n=1 Tax=Rubinisphaera brasiliensis (strain ATCC 49424 / DSM 5305 / JCM 21570 / IAM 15109 / NBRC 103401 / IFAM 1448) TaxID=756272 RepID=F0SRN6_RUBBR|nr:arylsulfatase [Rubinisphaera brasiliensis]ADY59159.1 sulfatase [Rubinisphaera brasiliensis DSM 5305]
MTTLRPLARRLLFCLAAAVLLFGDASAQAAQKAKKQPNIIFILADDLGYGELGCFGQEKIKTPHLDEMAAEGMKLTSFYAGATVCAPSRCVLMTGLHTGHGEVRGNSSSERQALNPEDVTVAEALQKAGYHTGLIGKWGLGEPGGGERGMPNKQGFDYSFGYLSQFHAHNYYPEILWRNGEKVHLRNEVNKVKEGKWGSAGWATKRVDYSHDLFMQDAERFLRDRSEKPFFLYLALTVPHANNEGTRGTGDGQEVPDHGMYADKDWSNPNKGQAAMITRMDAGIGRLFDILKEMDKDKETIVFFSSDNGPHNEGGHTPELFNPGGPLRGMKRDLYEGGIRVPTIVRWPGHVPAGSESDYAGYFGDFFATACDLAGTKPPKNLDSISLVPLLTGHPQKQQKHDYLYWEFYERGSKQAVRQGKWKAIRIPMLTGEVELYDLSKDLGEEKNIAGQNPKVVDRMIKLMDQAHTPHPNWNVPKPRNQPKKQASAASASSKK